jgi:hypothetical protein
MLSALFIAQGSYWSVCSLGPSPPSLWAASPHPWLTFLSWEWRRQVASKRHYVSMGLAVSPHPWLTFLPWEWRQQICFETPLRIYGTVRCRVCVCISEPDGRLMILVVSDTNTLLVYERTRLVWSAQLLIPPVAVTRATFEVTNLSQQKQVSVFIW